MAPRLTIRGERPAATAGAKRVLEETSLSQAVVVGPAGKTSLFSTVAEGTSIVATIASTIASTVWEARARSQLRRTPWTPDLEIDDRTPSLDLALSATHSPQQHTVYTSVSHTQHTRAQSRPAAPPSGSSKGVTASGTPQPIASEASLHGEAQRTLLQVRPDYRQPLPPALDIAVSAHSSSTNTALD